MPKRYKGLYDQILSFEVLYDSWVKSARGRHYQRQTLEFEANLEANLFRLIDELKDGSYQISGYVEFYVYEPKLRKVARLKSFRDRIVQHAVYSVLEPLYEKIFIADSYACRKSKGTHAGADRAEQLIRKVRREHGKVYALKCDIGSYFASIDHGVLLRILRRKIGDHRMVLLLERIIKSFSENGKGLPLGNLTSQIFANIYLNELDHFVKHDRRVKNYVRYMDDFVFLHHDKGYLGALRVTVEFYLDEQLKLNLNRKTVLFPVSSERGRALDFLGYRILPNRRMLRRRAISAMRKKIETLHIKYTAGEIGFTEVKTGMASHFAHASHADSSAILLKILHKPFRRAL